jgi:hypothetical protein
MEGVPTEIESRSIFCGNPCGIVVALAGMIGFGHDLAQGGVEVGSKRGDGVARLRDIIHQLARLVVRSAGSAVGVTASPAAGKAVREGFA